MTLHTYILKFYIMMKMIGLILLDPLNQKIHGKIEQKKASNSRFQIQIRGSNILRLIWVKKVLGLNRFSILFYGRVDNIVSLSSKNR